MMALLGLFWTSLLAATLLPGGSEMALILAYQQQWAAPFSLLLAASIGNTIGGLITFWLGWQSRKIQSIDALFNKASSSQKKALSWLNRFGHWSLLLSWTPIIGDLLCLGAGWLRLNPYLVSLALLIGKTMRYILVLFLLAGML